jgi:hypothetical protein
LITFPHKRNATMNITLYPIEDADNGEFNPFTIELDGRTHAQYIQKASRGLYRNSKSGTTLSSRCTKCGNVRIGELPGVCAKCGSTTFSLKNTNPIWAVCDDVDIPEHLLGPYDPLPAFWGYLEEKISRSTFGGADFEEAYIHPDDIENAYQVEHLTDNEILEEFACTDGFENLYPDHSQDWPVAAEVAPYRVFRADSYTEE